MEIPMVRGFLVSITNTAAGAGESERTMVSKPGWVEEGEYQLAQRIHLHPNFISLLKLLVVTPLLFLTLKQVGFLVTSASTVAGLFLAFALLDYLDGIVARNRGLESPFGRFLDRFTDYPLLLIVSYFSISLLPASLLLGKIGLDCVLFVLFVMGKGSTENRLRTGISYATLLSLLFLSQGWLPQVISTTTVEYLLTAGILFSATVAFYNLGILQKRFIADALSAANLCCGIFSMVFAARGRFEVSLLFLILGAAFDGFDGAAARKFGGTRFGVYSDDIADGVNYGIAPGVALYFVLGGIEGVVLGLFFTTFTISRLVFFTLNKDEGDPEYFNGAPSTIGGLVTLCSVILFQEHTAVMGLFVGLACALMVAFEMHYKHLGRALSRHRRALLGAPVYVLVLLLGMKLWGVAWPVSIILTANIIYGLWPTISSFRRVIVKS